jgi:hypothetical protein
MKVEQFVEAVTQGQSVAPLYFLFAATKIDRLTSCMHDEGDHHDVATGSVDCSKQMALS